MWAAACAALFAAAALASSATALRHEGRLLARVGRAVPDAEAAKADEEWDAEEPICSFLSFTGGTRGVTQKMVATAQNLLYRSGIALAIQGSNGWRHLVFQNAGDLQCHEQAQVRCEPSGNSSLLQRGAERRSLAAWAAAHAQPASTDGVDRCWAVPCNADANGFSLSVVETMLGAAVGTRPQADKVAVIGLGAGMISTWLQKHRLGLRVDNVDIDQGVVDAVHCFGVLPGKNGVNIFREDGRAFLESKPEGEYDAIIVDAFTDTDDIPGCLTTVEFFHIVRTRLKPGGGLVMNTWRKNVDIVLPGIRQEFPNVEIGRAPGLGNRVLHATATPSPGDGGIAADAAAFLAAAQFQEPPDGLIFPLQHPGQASLPARHDEDSCPGAAR